ncbi:DUF3313 domain-containing protein [Erwinia sp. V71]|uniref:DUF3313 domain-containing protein n=1 Tax=Erwinia sp. V71 TaxID=3369424 RepID=UPI003F628C3B
MKHRIANRVIQAATLAAVITVTGCASNDPVRYSGLASSAQLSPNTAGDKDRIPYKYATPVDWKKYDRLLIDPVMLYQGGDSQFDDMDPADRKKLADYMQQKFYDVLHSRFITTSPARADSAVQPGTLRLKLTLTGADTTPQVVGTVTKFDLAGGPYNIVQSIRGGRGMMSGSVNYAVEVHDAVSGQLLLAYVAQQYPNAMNISATIGSLSAAEVGIDKGADQLLELMQ